MEDWVERWAMWIDVEGNDGMRVLIWLIAKAFGIQ